ncbi:MAG: c-type cytochrome [Duganella sp.]
MTDRVADSIFRRAAIPACIALSCVLNLAPAARAANTIPADTLQQRVAACTACHAVKEKRDAYFPRIAGKPAGYLYHQLVNFRDGRRQHATMRYMVAHLSDDYLREIAAFFAAQQPDYPPSAPGGSSAHASASSLARGQQLVRHGDASRKIPACASCHGASLAGVEPAIPGLLGLPSDYINAQFGAWKSGARRAHAPDCMADIAGRLSVSDVAAVSAWLGRQPADNKAHPASANSITTLPLRCGGVSASTAGTITGNASIQTQAPHDARLARGAYLARAGNCMACHTVRGGPEYAGGRAIATPFGEIMTPNLTPDLDTGIGRWSADDFWRALHHGVSKGGRLLYPAFPYPNYTRISRDDADALHTWLRTLTPVQQANQQHRLRFPYNQQLLLAAWRALYFRPGEYQVDSRQSLDWNRGAYLVQGLGHCSACHSPRNWLGASSGESLSGALLDPLGWYAPPLQAGTGSALADWPAEHLPALLKTGVAPRATMSGPMAQVVQQSLQHLSDADIAAMTLYLRSLPPSPEVKEKPAGKRQDSAQAAAFIAAGARLYQKHCVDCHGANGGGQAPHYPALAGNQALNTAPVVNPVRIILNGGFAAATAGNPRPYSMPAFGHVLDDTEVAQLLSYLRGSWGNQAAPVSATEINRYRAVPLD